MAELEAIEPQSIPSIETDISPTVVPKSVPVNVIVSPPYIQPNLGEISVTVGVNTPAESSYV